MPEKYTIFEYENRLVDAWTKTESLAKLDARLAFKSFVKELRPDIIAYGRMTEANFLLHKIKLSRATNIREVKTLLLAFLFSYKAPTHGIFYELLKCLQVEDNFHNGLVHRKMLIPGKYHQIDDIFFEVDGIVAFKIYSDSYWRSVANNSFIERKFYTALRAIRGEVVKNIERAICFRNEESDATTHYPCYAYVNHEMIAEIFRSKPDVKFYALNSKKIYERSYTPPWILEHDLQVYLVGALLPLKVIKNENHEYDLMEPLAKIDPVEVAVHFNHLDQFKNEWKEAVGRTRNIRIKLFMSFLKKITNSRLHSKLMEFLNFIAPLSFTKRIVHTPKFAIVSIQLPSRRITQSIDCSHLF